MEFRNIMLCLITVVTPALLAQPAAAATTALTTKNAAQTAVSVRTQVAGIRARLQDVIEELALRNTLSATQVDTLRRELADIFADLEELEASLGTTAPTPAPVPGPVPPYSATWKSYADAALRVSPRNAAFDGWNSDASIKLDYGNSGRLLLSVDNLDYTSTWTISNAYQGSVKTSVDSESDGDVIVTVQDTAGSHQYMIKDGGLGPIYVRSTSVTGSPTTPGAPSSPAGRWYTPYRNAVDNGSLQDTRAMEWFIQQFQDNAYVTDELRALGEMLGDLTGVTQSGPVAYLSYVSAGRQQQVRIPDPRRNPGTFSQAIEVIYGLDQDEEAYIITLAD